MEPVTMIAAATLAANVGKSAMNWFNQRKAKRKRRDFFNTNIKGLLDESTQMPDVDYDSIREAEMRMPQLNLQNQMQNISRNRDVSMSRSGFVNSGFSDSDVNTAKMNASEQFSSQEFNINRGINDMQSQLDDMINQNRLRAKELEFQYKFG